MQLRYKNIPAAIVAVFLLALATPGYSQQPAARPAQFSPEARSILAAQQALPDAEKAKLLPSAHRSEFKSSYNNERNFSPEARSILAAQRALPDAEKAKLLPSAHRPEFKSSYNNERNFSPEARSILAAQRALPDAEKAKLLPGNQSGRSGNLHQRRGQGRQ